MVASLFSRADVRKLLDQIPTDADFDALCIDYFPDVYRRFTSGMDRVQKTNLLLALVPDLKCILDMLLQRFPNTTAHASQNSGLCRNAELMPSHSSAAHNLSHRLPTAGLAFDPESIERSLDECIAVNQSDEIHETGRLRFTPPSCAQKTAVETHCQIETGSDLYTGVDAQTTTFVPASLPRIKGSASAWSVGLFKRPPIRPKQRAWSVWASIAAVLGIVALGAVWIGNSHRSHPHVTPSSLPVYPVVSAQPSLSPSVAAVDTPYFKATASRPSCKKGMVKVRGLAGIRAATLGTKKLELKEPQPGDLPDVTVELCPGQYRLFCDDVYKRTVTILPGKNADEDCN